MRLSTSLIYDRGLNAITEQQSSLSETQLRLSTGRRVLRPSDDPIASSRAIATSQSLGLNASYGVNQSAAGEALALAESTLGSAGDTLTSIRTLLLQANNSTLTNADRTSIADEVASRFDELLGLANARDGAGGYLFSGYSEKTQPFSRTATGATYNGDEGRRQLQVGAARTIDISEPGSAIFDRALTGNGTFATSAAAGNTGNGVISVGSVTNRAALTGHTYRLQFNAAGTTTTYDVLDVTAGTTISAGNAFTAGVDITVAGQTVAVTGQPGSGDTFDIAPSTNQSVFTTIANAIAVLRQPAATDPERADVAQGVATALANIDQASERFLSARTTMGARMREVDSLSDLRQDLDLQYKSRLSDLQDADYAQEASNLARQQQGLEAAWTSYQKITKLSLFDFIG